MSTSESIRTKVSEAYGKAVRTASARGCCAAPAPEDATAKTTSYTPDELATLPAELLATSFGSGNPLAFGQVKEGEVVLDLGSGAGLDLLLAARKVGPSGRVIGIDMTEEMLAKARENVAASGLTNVELRKGLIEALPVDSSSVDWVISNCVINLSPEKERVFREIARVLKPGGRMLISDIVVESLPEWVRASEALYTTCVAGAISEAEYLEGVRRAGFQEVRVLQRTVYDTAHLQSLIRDEISHCEPEPACCGGGVSRGRVREAAESLAGKISSATFSARKPTS